MDRLTEAEQGNLPADPLTAWPNALAQSPGRRRNNHSGAVRGRIELLDCVRNCTDNVIGSVANLYTLPTMAYAWLGRWPGGFFTAREATLERRRPQELPLQSRQSHTTPSLLCASRAAPQHHFAMTRHSASLGDPTMQLNEKPQNYFSMCDEVAEGCFNKAEQISRMMGIVPTNLHSRDSLMRFDQRTGDADVMVSS